jgi:hypothetical protein
MRPILDEVVGPDVIAVLGAQPDARPVCQPQTPAFRLLRWNLQPLTPPDPLDPLVIDEPARVSQQRGNLAIAVAAVLTSKLDDVGGQPLLVVSPRWCLPLRRAMLPERRVVSKTRTFSATATLGDVRFTSNMVDANSAACGA